MVHKYLRDFTGQRFLGALATFGDDRRMTYYGLLEGTAIYQETAQARTAVPENLKHFMRQQQPWNKSFFGESLVLLRTMPLTRVAWWLTAARDHDVALFDQSSTRAVRPREIPPVTKESGSSTRQMNSFAH
jgi:hypothetical protein